MNNQADGYFGPEQEIKGMTSSCPYCAGIIRDVTIKGETLFCEKCQHYFETGGDGKVGTITLRPNTERKPTCDQKIKNYMALETNSLENFSEKMNFLAKEGWELHTFSPDSDSFIFVVVKDSE